MMLRRVVGLRENIAANLAERKSRNYGLDIVHMRVHISIVIRQVNTAATSINRTNPMASSNPRDRLFWSGLWIFSVATSISSMVFMALAFYAEASGRAMMFIEPNRVLAAGELATVVTGIIALLLLFMHGLRDRD